jgi:lactate dehydrogenase-like 2-hydroxyacid dehydrogenase
MQNGLKKPQVLLCGIVVWAWPEIDALRHKFEFMELDVNSRAEFLDACKPDGKYGKVRAIYRHNNSAEHIGVFDANLVAALPHTVEYICHNGAGYDQIDVAACTKRGIKVSNTPGAVDDATATVAMYLLLGALRGFYAAEKNGREGKFKAGLKPAHDPENKTLGIVGMGGIGRALARRALGFSMKIIYHNRKPLPASSLILPATTTSPEFNLAPFVTYIPTLDGLLAKADVVSLNLPLNERTKGSFGKKQFDTMKRGAVLINTARGGVVDEFALLAALESGQLSSAGLDVFPDEPNINPALRSNPKISILPHMGTETEESQHKMEVRVLHNNILPALKGLPLGDPVPEQKGLF